MGTQLQLILVVLLLLQLCLMNKTLAKLSPDFNKTAMTKPGCPYRCKGGNNITIPYPFGIGPDCARDETFIITCNKSFHPPRPFISGIDLQVLSISIDDAWVRVDNPQLEPTNPKLSSNSSTFSTTYIINVLDWDIDGNCSRDLLLDENGSINSSTSCSLHSECKLYLSDTRFYCTCLSGYEGNPYLPDGYQDVDECSRPESSYCTGECVNIPGSFKCMTPHKKIAMTGEEGNVEKSKLFTSKELKKATDQYNKNRILGQGGQGTVYKGMLTDGRIAAIKVSTMVDEGNLEQFINEYIHEKNEEFPLSWDVRLRIATEVASALSYLHSAASLPIYHRDIKSKNILLDEQYKAKVADFGTSRSIAIDQTHLTTRVSGTFGYLDPEYFQSSQFTEKSDVYSFGVVLIELLTSQKPILSTRSEGRCSLTTYFMVASKEKRLFDILDAQVRKEGGKKEITRVANLAKRCLSLSGRRRPTMREVTVELEGIRIPNGASSINELDEEGGYDITELTF